MVVRWSVHGGRRSPARRRRRTGGDGIFYLAISLLGLLSNEFYLAISVWQDHADGRTPSPSCMSLLLLYGERAPQLGLFSLERGLLLTMLSLPCAHIPNTSVVASTKALGAEP